MNVETPTPSYPEWALAAFLRYIAPAMATLKASSFPEQEWMQSCGPGATPATRLRLFPGSLYLLWVKALGGNEFKNHAYIAAALECMHNASLHHDDALDGNDSRRGEQTVLALQGPSASLLAGDGLIGTALRLVGYAHNPAGMDLVSMLGNAWYRMTVGQLLDEPITWQCVAVEQREEHWMSMTRAKLALGNIAAPLAALSVARPELVDALARLHEQFSVASQIMNDIGDLEEWAGFHVIAPCKRERGQESRQKHTLATIWQDTLKAEGKGISSLHGQAYQAIQRITSDALNELAGIPIQSPTSDILYDFFARPLSEYALVLKETKPC